MHLNSVTLIYWLVDWLDLRHYIWVTIYYMFYYTQYKTQYIIFKFHLVTILRNVGKARVCGLLFTFYLVLFIL